MAYVGVGRRAVAVILDLIVLASLGSPIWLTGWVFNATGSSTGPNQGFGTVQMGVSPWTGVLLALLPFAYFTLMEGAFGATAGKMLLGLRVVKLDGSPIDWQEAIIRNLLRYIDEFVLYLVAAISVWTSPTRQRLGDRAAGTVVVRRAHAAVPAWTRAPGAEGAAIP